jgi:hypothetical protein
MRPLSPPMMNDCYVGNGFRIPLHSFRHMILRRDCNYYNL